MSEPPTHPNTTPDDSEEHDQRARYQAFYHLLSATDEERAKHVRDTQAAASKLLDKYQQRYEVVDGEVIGR